MPAQSRAMRTAGESSRECKALSVPVTPTSSPASSVPTPSGPVPTDATRTEARSAANHRIVVGVADMAITSDPSKHMVTYALGSCIAVMLYDPVAKIGGMLHFMLPEAKTCPQKAAVNPAMFADTGISLLFNNAYKLGADRGRLIVCAAGGAEILAEDRHFCLGARNRTMLRKILWQHNLLLTADDTGGTLSRTVTLSLNDGLMTTRSQGKESVLWAPTT